jgi:hypothetical protein
MNYIQMVSCKQLDSGILHSNAHQKMHDHYPSQLTLLKALRKSFFPLIKLSENIGFNEELKSALHLQGLMKEMKH